MTTVDPTTVTVSIYGLTDESGLRYVGQTSWPLDNRLTVHLSTGRHLCRTKGTGRLSPYALWLRALMTEGKQPDIVLLETTDAAHADEVEDRFITTYRAQGVAIVNDPRRRYYGRMARLARPPSVPTSAPSTHPDPTRPDHPRGLTPQDLTPQQFADLSPLLEKLWELAEKRAREDAARAQEQRGEEER
jgi:hypothetical protein